MSRLKKNSFVSGTFIATSSVVLVKILGMLYVIPFYSIVGSKGGALYSYAYSVYLIFLQISTAGIPNAISKVISEYNTLGYLDAKVRAYNISKKIISYFSVIMFILLFVFAEEFGRLIIGNITGGNTIEDVSFVIRCCSLAVLVIPHLSIAKGFLQGHNYITPSSVANLLEQIVRIFVILAGSFLAYKVFNKGLTLTVGVAVLGAFVGGIVAYIYLIRKINKNKSDLSLERDVKKDNISNKDITKKIIKYSVPFVIISLVNNIYSFTDMLLVLRTLNFLNFSAEDVEFVASVISTWGGKISMIVNSIAMGLTTSLLPTIVSAYAAKDYSNLNNKINKALQIIIYVSLPLTIGISILATPVWTIFYNTNSLGGAILKVMIFNALLGNITSIVSAILHGCNGFKGVYLTNITGFVINALLDVPLMLICYKIGIGAYYGAVIASMIGYSLSIFIGIRLISKENKDNLMLGETVKLIFKFLVPSFAMIVVLYFVNKYLPFNPYVKLESLLIIIINVIIGGIIFIVISFKLKLPQEVFGENELNKLIKKLTFGKFKLKNN